MGNFNMTHKNHHLKDFTDSNDFENLIKEPTYFKSTSPTTIDLFLTNKKRLFYEIFNKRNRNVRPSQTHLHLSKIYIRQRKT